MGRRLGPVNARTVKCEEENAQWYSGLGSSRWGKIGTWNPPLLTGRSLKEGGGLPVPILKVPENQLVQINEIVHARTKCRARELLENFVEKGIQNGPTDGGKIFSGIRKLRYKHTLWRQVDFRHF